MEEMVYMRKREEAMRNTNGVLAIAGQLLSYYCSSCAARRSVTLVISGCAESTNARVLWFSVFSVCVLLSTATWQVDIPTKHARGSMLLELVTRISEIDRFSVHCATDVSSETILQEEEADLVQQRLTPLELVVLVSMLLSIKSQEKLLAALRYACQCVEISGLHASS